MNLTPFRLSDYSPRVSRFDDAGWDRSSPSHHPLYFLVHVLIVLIRIELPKLYFFFFFKISVRFSTSPKPESHCPTSLTPSWTYLLSLFRRYTIGYRRTAIIIHDIGNGSVPSPILGDPFTLLRNLSRMSPCPNARHVFYYLNIIEYDITRVFML